MIHCDQAHTSQFPFEIWRILSNKCRPTHNPISSFINSPSLPHSSCHSEPRQQCRVTNCSSQSLLSPLTASISRVRYELGSLWNNAEKIIRSDHPSDVMRDITEIVRFIMSSFVIGRLVRIFCFCMLDDSEK